jgi:hypothetical protein
VSAIGVTNRPFEVAFATGRDSPTFRDKGTEVPSLSRDKGTTGQAQNLATGRDGIFDKLSRPVPGRPGTITFFCTFKAEKVFRSKIRLFYVVASFLLGT